MECVVLAVYLYLRRSRVHRASCFALMYHRAASVAVGTQARGLALVVHRAASFEVSIPAVFVGGGGGGGGGGR